MHENWRSTNLEHSQIDCTLELYFYGCCLVSVPVMQIFTAHDKTRIIAIGGTSLQEHCRATAELSPFQDVAQPHKLMPPTKRKVRYDRELNCPTVFGGFFRRQEVPAPRQHAEDVARGRATNKEGPQK